MIIPNSLSSVASGFILHLLSFYFSYLFQTLIALGSVLVGSESHLLLNASILKKKCLDMKNIKVPKYKKYCQEILHTHLGSI